MASRMYWAGNYTTGSSGVTTAPAKVTTGTAIKSMLQLSTPATVAIEVIEWGISFDGSSAATPGVCELVNTGAINATVTPFVAADLMKMSQAAAGMASQLTVGSANSGFTSSAEGTITATQEGDLQLLPPTAPYIKQFPLERGHEALLSTFERIRVTFGTAINALCYAVWIE